MAKAPQDLAILLISGGHERAHYAFVLASAAAALGRTTTIFATNEGLHALAADWSGLADAGRDAVVRRLGVAGLGELRDAATELSVRLMACEAGLRSIGLTAGDMMNGVEIAGVATFLQASDGASVVTL